MHNNCWMKTRLSPYTTCLMAALMFGCLTGQLSSQETANSVATADSAHTSTVNSIGPGAATDVTPKSRELLVPFNDLHLLLGQETRRVFMTREELAQLKAAARRAPDEALPQQVAWLGAQYDATLESGRAVLIGKLQIEVLGEGLHALPLDIRGVGVRSALLDDKPAALNKTDNEQIQLIVSGRGLHELQLEMVLPVATAAAQQSLSWVVPVPPATRFHLSVPGNVELKSGASVLNRRVDQTAGVTHFDLLPGTSGMDLVMSLNNKRLRDETTTLARGVLISEITQGYQRLHANLSMNVLHGASDEFRIGIPSDYEITQVTSPLLARWSVEHSQEASSGKLLVVKLRELVSDRTTLQFRADRLRPVLGQWQMPQLEPLKVAGFASVIGILIEDQLTSQTIDSEQLIPIDNQILTAAIPASVLAQEPGAPRVRPLATFYAPQPQYNLSARVVMAPAELKVTSNLMLTFSDRGLEANGGFALLPSSEKLFNVDVSLPPDWHVDSMTLADGRSLHFEHHESNTGGRVRVQLPDGLAPGSTQSILFHANHTPKDWLGDWTEQTIALPRISIAQSPQVHERGALTVRGIDDLTLQPETLSGLIVISDSEKSKYGCADVPLNFAWRTTEDAWQGSMKVVRATPRLTGRALSFFQVNHAALAAHYELLYDVDQARAQRVGFSLPESTPIEISVRGLGDTVVKETSSQVTNGRRIWNIQLADKRIGQIKLAVNFSQPMTPAQLANATLPGISLENVAYQSGLVALEGDAELDISISQHPRAVDIGELIDAEYQVGSRLLGVYSYVGDASNVTITAQQRTLHGLPTTLVERADLVTLIGAGGMSQTAAKFLLRTKAQYLEVRLPDGAKLWSIMVDGAPALPERQADRVVVALKATAANQQRDVRVVYEHAIRSVGLRSQVALLAPSLWHRAEAGSTSEPVPLVDLHWEAVLPTGYRLAQHAGTVTSEQTKTTAWKFADRWPQTLLPSSAREQSSMMDYAPTAPAAPAAQKPEPAPSPISSPAEAEQVADVRSMAWALDGLRCLNIDLTPARFGETVTFASLGLDPTVRLTLINQRRWEWLGLAGGLLTFIVGLTLIKSSFIARLSYSVMMLLAALLVAVASGWTLEMESVVAAILASGVALVITTSVVVVVRKIIYKMTGRIRQASSKLGQATSAVLMLLAVVTAFACSVASTSYAQDTAGTPVTNLAELSALIDALPGSPALSIPADAIVVPYEASAPSLPPGSIASADSQQKILVPYDTYVQLWNAAHPDQRLSTRPPVVPYAWSAAHYDATLATTQETASKPDAKPLANASMRGSDALMVSGTFNIELFSESGVTIPLTLGGGVLQSMTVDGQAARLQLVEPLPLAQTPQADPMPGVVAPGAGVMLLHLSGKGAHEIKLVVRMKIERRGGWQAVEGRLPVAPATGLTLRVPTAGTEVRLTGNPDRTTHEIDRADSRIETALPTDGRVAWHWRTKIAEVAMDQGLSVDSQAVFDVQEDGLRFAWQGNFEFRRGRRESFTLLVPADYLVQKVLGNNIRGWNVATLGDSQQLTIDLLAAVAERETVVVQLFRKHAQRDTLGAAPAVPATNASTETIAAPVIRVPDAMLQKGRLTIRRSRLLDLRAMTSSGLSRIDTPDNSQWLVEQADTSPVPLVTFQAFQYSQVPYSYQLTARATRSQVQVTARTLLHLSEAESTLESQLMLNVSERQLYRLRISVPKNWKLQPPAIPITYEWSSVANEDNQTIELRFADGVIGNLPIVLRGPLEQTLTTGNDPTIPSVPLPKIAVEDVAQQSGDIVVVSDPAYAVRAEQLQNCERGLLGTANSWLAAAQQPLAQLLVHYSSADMAGQLQIVRRVPQVSSFSISNIKVTDRSIEETLFFEFTIRTAGIRQISLVVPRYLERCRVRGPLMRSQTWTPVSPESDAPVRLTVELQEEVMGQYSLILEHDRVLASGTQSAPIPQIETGQTEHRFVTLENSGRDELLVEQSIGMERLQRAQSQWNTLASLLGGKTNEAFVVNAQAENPRLTFNTKDRAVIETVGARIGIAKTYMIIDENGTYRASSEYRIENRTEQYLEIELPLHAQLWTVTVAGEPVKPMTAAAPQHIRLPLVKTAAGDLDYAVVIKYGGQVPRPGSLGTTRFPLVKAININVELSQVRLRLPTALKWWNFGGSMARVQSEDELTAGWLAFRTRQLTDLTQMLSKSAKVDFSRARALSNLKQLGAEVQEYQATAQGRTNEDLQRQLASNGAAWFEAQKELAKPSDAAADAEPSNRLALNERLQLQQNGRSLNVANSPESGFKLPENFAKPQAGAKEFDAQWLMENSLDGVEMVDELSAAGKGFKEEDRLGRISKGKNNYDANGASPAQPVAPPLPQLQPSQPQSQFQSQLQTQTKSPIQLGPGMSESKMEDRAAQVFRYQQQLDRRGNAARTSGAIASTPPLTYAAPNSVASNGEASLPGTEGAMIVGGQLSGGQLSNGQPTAGVQAGMNGGGMNGVTMSDADFQAAGVRDADQSKLELEGRKRQPVTGPTNTLALDNISGPTGYLVSLDAQLPVRGEEYLFSTPRGAVEITAQSIANETLARWSTIAVLILLGSTVWMVSRRFLRK